MINAKSRREYLVVVWMLLLACFPISARSTTCDEDCHGRCRQCIKYDLGFIKDEKCAIEPQCHLRCEIEKKAACALRTPIPSIPTLPTNPLLAPRELEQACKVPFESFTHSTIAYCANWSGRADDLDKVDSAKQILISLGLASASEFNGIDIRWCPLNGSGMVPESNRMLLNPKLKSSEFALVSTLAHEMHHIRQFRQWGGDSFKCRYSTEMLRGNGQSRANAVERDAYEYEDQVEEILKRGRAMSVCNNSSMDAYVAVGFQSGTIWKAKGWYKVEANKCADTGISSTGYVYAYASTNPAGTGTTWTTREKEVHFCIDPTAKFELGDASCQPFAHPDYKWMLFGVAYVGGYGKYTWTLGK